jgi:3-hydroxyisobutyrate dehydrogenase-like beta-hydroxyacid dehydrogenase
MERQMTAIGLIGLGNAGRPMAERLLARGYRLHVFDLDAAKVQAAVERGATAAHSAGEAVQNVTITLLPSALEIRQAIVGRDGILAKLQAGHTLIDLSGTDPDCARDLQARVAQKGAVFIGGTIHASGAPAVTIPAGRFSIVVGGEKAKLQAVAEILNDVADTVICLPEPWMPKAFKIAIILYATTNNIITAEICSWLTAQGADPKLFLKLLQTTGSAASASRLQEFMKRNNHHGGALSNSYKDFRQALDLAAKLEIPMPLASMANQIQEMARALGLQRLNSPAAMGKLYEMMTGMELSQTALESSFERAPESHEKRIAYLGD